VGGGGFQGSSVGGPAEGFGVISFPQHSLQKSLLRADKPKEGSCQSHANLVFQGRFYPVSVRRRETLKFKH